MMGVIELAIAIILSLLGGLFLLDVGCKTENAILQIAGVLCIALVALLVTIEEKEP